MRYHTVWTFHSDRQTPLAPAYTVTGPLTQIRMQLYHHFYPRLPSTVLSRSDVRHWRFPTNSNDRLRSNYVSLLSEDIGMRWEGKGVLREQWEEIVRVAATADAGARSVCGRTKVRQQFRRIIDAIQLQTQRQTQWHQLTPSYADQFLYDISSTVSELMPQTH